MTDSTTGALEGLAQRLQLSRKKEREVFPIRGYASGSYFCKCYRCGETFTGDKRAYECFPCAIDGLRDASRASPPFAGDVERACIAVEQKTREILEREGLEADRTPWAEMAEADKEKCREVMGAALSALQPRVPEGWLPFSTAPESADPIVVYRPDAGIFMALYGSEAGITGIEDADDDLLWWSTDGEDLTGLLPTHWFRFSAADPGSTTPPPPAPVGWRPLLERMQRVLTQRGPVTADDRALLLCEIENVLASPTSPAEEER